LPRARLSTIREPVVIGALVLVGSLAIIGQGYAQEAGARGVRQTTAPSPIAITAVASRGAAVDDLSQMALPGGLRAALAVLRDYNPPDRSQFLIELIRRVHHSPSEPEGPREATLAALLTHLDAATAAMATTATESDAASETLPLPLTPQIWIDVVFGGRATSRTLVSEILRSRGASLLYHGLCSLDPETRTFFAGEPGLLHEIVARLGPAFAIAAPSLRVTGRRIAVPGGEPAIAAFEALVGRRVTEPAEFVRALLSQQIGRLAWFYGALAPLTPGQVRLALDMEAPDPPERVAAVRRLYDVFARVAGDWRIEGRTFWRPPLDPAIFVAALPVDAHGAPLLPGTRDFWTAVFAGASASDPAHLVGGDRLDFPWLCERIFDGEPAAHRRRLHQVMFISRVAPQLTAALAIDAAASARAEARYPALVAVLERLGVTDVALIARAARRAAELSDIDDDARAIRGIAQFQGLLALVARAAARGSLAPADAANLAASLVAVDPGRHGDYEGRLVTWLVAQLDTLAPDGRPRHPSSSGHVSAESLLSDTETQNLGEVERAVVLALAGRSPAQPRVVEWEGARYTVDLARAEIVRISRLFGDEPRPWLSSARALVALADSLGTSPLTAAARTRVTTTLSEIARSVDWTDDDNEDTGDTRARYREVAAMFGGATSGAAAARPAPRAPPRTGAATTALRVLADALFARGLLELTYAAALGQPDRAWISAGDAARSHDFGIRAVGGRRPDAPWRRPIAGADTKREWRATGGLLGLEVSLAELSLVRLSTRPPPRRPTLNEEDRRVLVEGIALVEPARFTDGDLERIVAAMERGRTRLGALRTATDAAAVADDVRLSPSRRTLLAWTVAHDPARAPAFLSPAELLWLGLDGLPVDAALHAWGAPGEAVDGCLCLRLLDRQPWETRAGRWGTGAFAGAFPDLTLRTGELLVTLQMPAVLVGPVLASALLDLVNMTASRGQDDRRSLVEFVQALTPERLEQYLALLTTDGPLVPADEGPEATAPGAATTRSGVPR
jgi:hypothetical protein